MLGTHYNEPGAALTFCSKQTTKQIVVASPVFVTILQLSCEFNSTKFNFICILLLIKNVYRFKKYGLKCKNCKEKSICLSVIRQELQGKTP